MLLKIGRYWINPAMLLYVTDYELHLVLSFPSNGGSDGNDLRLEGQDREAMLAWLRRNTTAPSPPAVDEDSPPF